MADRCETRNRPILKATQRTGNHVVFFRPRCKSWGCPYCAEINAGLWRARAMFGHGELVKQGKEIYFLTLTSHEKLNPHSTLLVWPSAWKKLHARAKYAEGKQEYLMVPEKHKDGRLHMHALCTWSLPERWWKDNARECGLGYMADHEKVRHPTGAGNYVTKYLSKSLTEINWPTRFRRIRASRGWPKLPEINDAENWRFTPLEKVDKLTDEVMRLQFDGKRVFVLDHTTAWDVIHAIDNDGVFPENDGTM